VKVEAMVFDLGGVLIDVDFGRAFAAWGKASDVAVETLAARFVRGEAFSAHERGEIEDAAFFANVRGLLGVCLSDDAMLAGWNAILGEPLPGIEALVSDLARRLPLYVFSNTNMAHVAHFKPRYRGLFSHFREVITSCELGRRKPEPEAFERLAARIGAAPSQLAFFDDLEENVAGAQGAGLQAFHVRTTREIAAIAGRLL
jgi:HAD superfamily hydrolase (TIGR01509 family)